MGLVPQCPWLGPPRLEPSGASEPRAMNAPMRPKLLPLVSVAVALVLGSTTVARALPCPGCGGVSSVVCGPYVEASFGEDMAPSVEAGPSSFAPLTESSVADCTVLLSVLSGDESPDVQTGRPQDHWRLSSGTAWFGDLRRLEGTVPAADVLSGWSSEESATYSQTGTGFADPLVVWRKDGHSSVHQGAPLAEEVFPPEQLARFRSIPQSIVPEPSTLLLLGAGIAGFLSRRRFM